MPATVIVPLAPVEASCGAAAGEPVVVEPVPATAKAEVEAAAVVEAEVLGVALGAGAWKVSSVKSRPLGEPRLRNGVSAPVFRFSRLSAPARVSESLGTEEKASPGVNGPVIARIFLLAESTT